MGGDEARAGLMSKLGQAGGRSARLCFSMSLLPCASNSLAPWTGIRQCQKKEGVRCMQCDERAGRQWLGYRSQECM